MSNDTSFIALAFYIIRVYKLAAMKIHGGIKVYKMRTYFLTRKFKESLKALVILYSAVIY